MYLISKSNSVIKAKYGVRAKTDLSKIWKVKRSPACKSGEGILLEKDDNNKFTIFAGYITFDSINDNFEMIKWKE